MAVHSSSYLFLQVVNHVFAGARGQCAALDFWNAAGKNLVQAIARIFNRDVSVPVIGREYFKAVHGINALRVVVVEAMRYIKPSEPLEGCPRRFYSNVAVLFLAGSHLSSHPAIFGIAKAAEVLSMTSEAKSCWRNRNGVQFRGRTIRESKAAQACKSLKVALFFLTNGTVFLSWIGYQLSPQAKKTFTYVAIAYSTVNFFSQFFNAHLLLRLSRKPYVPPLRLPAGPSLAPSPSGRFPSYPTTPSSSHLPAGPPPRVRLPLSPTEGHAGPQQLAPLSTAAPLSPTFASVSDWDSTVSSDFFTPYAGQEEVDLLYASALHIMHAISYLTHLAGLSSDRSSTISSRSSQSTVPATSPTGRLPPQ